MTVDGQTSTSVAILGGTSHIAAGLVSLLGGREGMSLTLFARDLERGVEVARRAGADADVPVLDFERVAQGCYDVLVNCVGFGSPARLRGVGDEIFRVTEQFDNFAMDYMGEHPSSLLISISSGAVCGAGTGDVLGREFKLSPDDMGPEHFYAIAKLHSEAKHRSRQDLQIVDLRVFGYFSRFIDPDSGFFLSDVVRSLKARAPLVTSPVDMKRDYVGPEDLARLVRCCVGRRPGNRVYDVYSRAPVSKREILDFCVREYGLHVDVKDGIVPESCTGRKPDYYSTSREAEEVGYQPGYSSLETVRRELAAIMGEEE